MPSSGLAMSMEKPLQPLSPEYEEYVAKDSEALVKVIKLRVWYPLVRGLIISKKKVKYVKAVNDVTFTIRQGEIFSLVGESGCGKTTLGKAIARLVPITSGSVMIYLDGREVDFAKLNDKEVRAFRRYVQVIFQDPYGSLNPRLKVRDIILEPLQVYGVTKNREEAEKMVKRMLEQVQLTPPEDFLDRYPHELSGGQRQRVAIARALILRPRLVVADEPISMLDVSLRADILNLMMDLKEQLNLTYLYITHDIATARYVGNRIGVLYLGFIVEIGDADKVVFNPAHPYTRALIAAVPTVDLEKKITDIPIKGDVPPNPIDLPEGCPFYPRCIYARDKCAKERPPLIKIDEEHFVACWYPL